MQKPVSVAIETSSRRGGVALGMGRELASALDFDASSRHATQLISRMKELLESQKLSPADIDELYVSAGPGSFTGVRVGVTVARTLAVACPKLRCVAVPTHHAIALNAGEQDWTNLGVVLDARQGLVWACLFTRRDGAAVQSGEPILASPAEFLSQAPRPLLLVGEGLAYHDLAAPGVSIAWPDKPDSHLPTASHVWQVGRSMAERGLFTLPAELLPIYARRPEAERLWQLRAKP